MKTEKNKYIKTLEDSGIDVEIEPTDEDPDDEDENREKNESIETLEDSGINVQIEPNDENHADDVEYRGKNESMGTLEDSQKMLVLSKMMQEAMSVSISQLRDAKINSDITISRLKDATMYRLIEAKIVDPELTISQFSDSTISQLGDTIMFPAKEAAQEVISNEQKIRRPKSLEEIEEDHEKNTSIKPLEDSGTNVEIEPTDEDHEKNESIKTDVEIEPTDEDHEKKVSIKPLEDSGSDVEIEPTDEDE